jgi:transposase
MRSTSWPGTKGNRPPLRKGALGTPPQAGGSAGPRHAGEGFGALRRTPPVLGLIRRGGQVFTRMLADVRRATIRPVIEAAVAKGARIHTDECASYARLPAWGCRHVTVCHAHGEYARDEDGDGFCEIHVNTMEGTWSLLRSWLRPHRGISQEKLPLYLGFFEFVHNARRRGRALLGALIAALVR